MTTVRLLDPPHILEAASGAELDSALEKAGQFLATKGLTDVLGVQTLHTHFSIADDEAALDTVDTDGTIWTNVVSLDSVQPSQATAWGFFPDGSSVALGYSHGAGMLRDSRVEAAVAQFGVFLAQNGLTRVLAAQLVDSQTGPGKVLLELTDEISRVQWTREVSAAEVGDEPAAGWVFSATGAPMARNFCSTNDNRH